MGYKTPGIIRFRFEQITYRERYATLLRINDDHAEPIRENAAKTICFDEDAIEIISHFVA